MNNNIQAVDTIYGVLPFRSMALAMCLAMSGCTSLVLSELEKPLVEDRTAVKSTALVAETSVVKARGGYYQNDGPGDNIPEDLLSIPDAKPKVEPFAQGPSRPYSVFGKTYTPITDNEPFTQRGIGSWYGKKYNGKSTASGEIYDMYQMTAAHPTLPIPSYARVTNLRNDKQIIVRVNDRGPFHADRIIDLSYTAALKLDYISTGSSDLQVDRLLPEEIARINPESETDQIASEEKKDSSAIPPLIMEAQTLNNMSQLGGVLLDGGGTVLDAGATVFDASGVVIDSLDGVSGVGSGVGAGSTAFAADSASAASSGFSNAELGVNAVSNAVAINAMEIKPIPIQETFFLQAGAYEEIANAQVALDKMLTVWPKTMLQPSVVTNRGLYRIQSGPFNTYLEATEQAGQLQAEAQIGTFVVR